MVPDGWKRESFGNVASFKNGLNFTKSDEEDIPQKEVANVR